MKDLTEQMHLEEGAISASYWRAVVWAKDACQA
jgi:hypothetical protein